MKKKEYVKKLCLFLAFILMFLSGCGKNSKKNTEETEKKMVSINNTTLHEYSDIVFDRSLTEGKMACYFFGSTNAWSTWQSSTHAGDSVLFIAPDGTTLLYDTNTPNNTAYVVYAMKQLGITKIDYFVNSHPHIDHIGGFAILAENFEIGQIYTPPAEAAYDGTKGWWYDTEVGTTAKQKGIPYSYLVAGDSFTLGKDVNVKVYNPSPDFDYSVGISDLNECSVVLKLTYKESSYLVGGDAGDDAEKYCQATESEMVAKYGSELQADVSKMNHHGDPVLSSSSEGWLQAVNSKIYVGTMSSVPDDIHYFKHVKTGATVYHTGIDGTVLVYTSGDGSYDVQIEKNRNSNYYGTFETKDGHMRVE